MESYTYTAYGERRVFSPSGAALPQSAVGYRVGFQGHLVEPSTGFIHMRARLYDPEMGRFLKLDPLGLADGSNPYQFAGGMPLMFLDPMGTDKKVL